MRWAAMVTVGLAGWWSAGCGHNEEATQTSQPTAGTTTQKSDKETEGDAMGEKMVKTDEEWKKELTEEQYHILREKGTERAFTGKYWNTMEDGAYRCAGCGLVLFRSEGKFVSECGWPSFSAPAPGTTIATAEDTSHGMARTEVMCPRCGGHLGHVFNDGPGPTGLRYCINSEALKFEAKNEEKSEQK